MKPFKATLLLLVAFLSLLCAMPGDAEAAGSSVYGQIFFNVGVYHVYPTVDNHTLYDQDGRVWSTWANSTLYCDFTPYTTNLSETMYANVSWFVNGTFSGNSSIIANVTNATSYVNLLMPDNMSANELWDCIVRINDSEGWSGEYTTSPLYSMYITPYTRPNPSPYSIHLSLFVLFIAVAMLCITLDVFADVPYLGVMGGVMLILMGTLMAFDIPNIYRVFCEPTYNMTDVQCITMNTTIETSMNTGISAMLWIIGLGIVLEAIYFRTNQVDREEL